MSKKRFTRVVARERVSPTIACPQKPDRIEMARATFGRSEDGASTHKTIGPYQLHIPIKGVRQIRKAVRQFLLESRRQARPIILPVED